MKPHNQFELIQQWARAGALIAASLPSLALAQGNKAFEGAPITVAEMPIGSPAAPVRNAAEFVEKWKSTESQIFVQGEVPLNKADERELSDFLTLHPHWSVLLLGNISSEQYGSLNGAEALEARLVNELSTTPGFSSLVNPKTRLANAAVIVIAFEAGHHHAMYLPSAHQVASGAGIDAWQAYLPALGESLRSGDMVGGLKQVISTIDERVVGEEGIPWGLVAGGVGLCAVAAGGLYLLTRESRNRSNRNDSGSSDWSFPFFFFDDGGSTIDSGSGGFFDGGGGGMGDGGW